MNPDDLARILDELGQRLGPSGEYVFALAVRQQVVVNAMWTVALVTVLIGSVAIAAWTLRRTRRLDEVIDGIEAAITARDKSTADIQVKIREYEKAREDAQVAAMTDEQRTEWFGRLSLFSGFGYSGHWGSSGPSVDDIRQHNGWSIGIVIGCTFATAVSTVGLLMVVPGLLTPEYAALRDILGTIGGSR